MTAVAPEAPAILALEHRDAALAIRRIAIPGAVAFLGDQLLGVVDTMAAGRLGTDALASIGSAIAAFLVIAIGLYAFTTGPRILGAQAIGAGRAERFGVIVRSGMVAPLAVGILAAALFALVARPLMHAMLPATVDPGDAAAYLRLRGTSLVPMAITMQLIGAFAAIGDTRLAVRVLLVINAVHVPLLGVLALGFLTGHAFGLVGAGTSSLVAELVGLCYVVRETARRPELRIFAAATIERDLVRATAALSWPDFVFLALQVAIDPVAIALVAPAGAHVLASMRAFIIVNDASWALPGPVGDACETVIAQRLGARDLPGADAFLASARGIAMKTTAVVAVLVAACAWPLTAAFTLSTALAGLAWAPLATHALVSLPLKTLGMVNAAPIRAAGDTRWIMRMGIASTAVATATLAICTRVFHLDLWALPIGFGAGWLYRNVATARRLRGGDWRTREVTG